MDDLIRESPSVVALVFAVLIALLGGAFTVLQWAAKRAIARLDDDIRAERKAREHLSGEIRDLRVEIVRWEGKFEAQADTVRAHMKEEERRIWPQLEQIRAEVRDRSDKDTASHAVILAKLSDHGAAIAAIEVLVLNGGKKA